MPRGRGGPRTGTPGKAYPQRTDLQQPVRTAPSQTYGDAAAQAQAQRAVPLPQQPGPPAVGPMPQGGPQAAAAQPPLDPFHRPSDRPGEPLTAGMATGPGPGPSAAQPVLDPVAETLRRAYQAMPSPQLAALLESVIQK